MLLMDPWVSPKGAFKSAWFQFPTNHFYFTELKQQISEIQTFIYISHEHKDHFDKHFLEAIVECQPTIVIPKFSSNDFYEEISELSFKNIIQLKESEKFLIPNSELSIKLFLDDTQLNRDSAIFVSNGKFNFLNLNDCKIFDRLHSIKSEENHINAFSTQFSGATWHPVCYSYDTSQYSKISKKKKKSKFLNVLKAIQALSPDLFLPSAGPACFIDPNLINIHYQEENIFPFAYELLDFLKEKKLTNCKALDIVPKDVICLKQLDYLQKESIRYLDKKTCTQHIEFLANKYKNIFNRKTDLKQDTIKYYYDLLKIDSAKKLNNFNVRDNYDINIYFTIEEYDLSHIELNLKENSVNDVKEVPDDQIYHLSFSIYDIKDVLDKKMTWEDFSLTFRVNIKRKPDKYDTLINGFFFSEHNNIEELIHKITNFRNNKERIVIECAGSQYEIDRYCPHQGADLKYGFSCEKNGAHWVCPRHAWEFDLENGGQSIQSSDSIHSVRCISFEAES